MTVADAAEASEAAAGRGSRSTAVHRGGGAKGDITADFISFAKSKGLYAGLNLDGSYLSGRDNQ